MTETAQKAARLGFAASQLTMRLMQLDQLHPDDPRLQGPAVKPVNMALDRTCLEAEKLTAFIELLLDEDEASAGAGVQGGTLMPEQSIAC